MTEREMILKKLSALQFAAWELHLYMDTHPADADAMAMYNKYTAKADELKKLYEAKYGPLCSENGAGEAWTKNPWPWDVKECEK